MRKSEKPERLKRLRQCCLGLATLVLSTACSERLAWRDVHAVNGDWQALLPDKPALSSRPIDLGDGRSATMSMTAAGVGPTLFAIGVAELPAGLCSDATVCARMLNQVTDGLARNVGARITTRTPVALSLPPQRKLLASQAAEARGQVVAAGRATPQQARLAVRLFVVDDRLYQMVALGAPEAMGDVALDTFFTSFRILPR